MGNGEIARHEQFLFFPQWFQKMLMRQNEYLWSKGYIYIYITFYSQNVHSLYENYIMYNTFT